MRVLLSALAFATSVVAFASTATAQSSDAVTAEALFREGRIATSNGDYASACPKFAESQRLDASVGTLMNLADCEEHEGRLAHAWALWHEAVDDLPTADDRLPLARTRVATIDRRVPKLTLRLSPRVQGARVTRDGIALAPASLGVPLPVDPGRHMVLVAVEGRPSWEQSVTLAEGQVVEVELDAGAPPRPLPAPSHDGKRPLGFVALGVGGVALATAVASAIVVVHEKSIVDADCGSNHACSGPGLGAVNSGRTWLAVNTASTIGAVVGGALGITLVMTSSRAATTRASASVDPHGGTVLLVTSF